MQNKIHRLDHSGAAHVWEAMHQTCPHVVKRIGTLCLCVLPIFFLGACGTTPTREAVPAARLSQDVPSRLSPELANDVTMYAVGLVGTPYRYGGNTPESGFDCSGLIGHVYQARAGVTPPRTVSKMKSWGQPIPSDKLRTGDLVLFAQGGDATHAGIYVGDGRFVHAPSTGGEVRLDRLTSKYWAAQQVAFRRP
jgi:cell wall-associated NlpC family hydrolase